MARKNPPFLLIANVFSLVSFTLLTLAVFSKQTLFTDLAIAKAIYNIRTPLLTTVMFAITFLGGNFIIVIGIIVGICLIIKKRVKEMCFLAITGFGGCILNLILKNLFLLPRPNAAPLYYLTDFSYPSGHAMNNLILFGILGIFVTRFIKNRDARIISLFIIAIWIGLVGFSRVYLGVHYPSDILAGYLIGFWWLTLCMLIKLRKRDLCD